jgi:DNA-binding NarL/FixJ family response regulator
VEAVQVLARGDALLSPGVTRRVIERLKPNALPVHPEYHAPGAPTIGGTIPPELTERETEVLVCLARGRSNAEIAAELFVGEATVKTHVSNVLTKLGVRDRIQAVVYAYENGIAVRGGDTDPSR